MQIPGITWLLTPRDRYTCSAVGRRGVVPNIAMQQVSPAIFALASIITSSSVVVRTSGFYIQVIGNLAGTNVFETRISVFENSSSRSELISS